MFLLGVDPGFANFGWALCDYEGGDLVPLRMGTISTEKDKRRVLVCEDNVKRFRKLSAAFDSVVVQSGGDRNSIAICAESMSFPRNASASAKVAMAWGLILSYDLPLIQRSPQEVKLAVAGSRSASKAKIETILTRSHPTIPMLLGGVPKSRWEHPVDAFAVVVACLDDPLIRAMVQR
jgi:Holliday junction resolvasome RuvABC endonuclease subunit